MKLAAFCGASADGFLARADDGLDFLSAGEQEPHGFTDFLRSIDVVVIGRRTFEVVRGQGHLGLYGGKPMIVLISRPLGISAESTGSVETMTGGPVFLRDQLESRSFRHAYVDGGITIQRFLSAGCLDRLIVTGVPVLIGTGVPLFGPTPFDILLRHVATTTCPGGLVQSEYTIQR